MSLYALGLRKLDSSFGAVAEAPGSGAPGRLQGPGLPGFEAGSSSARWSRLYYDYAATLRYTLGYGVNTKTVSWPVENRNAMVYSGVVNVVVCLECHNLR